MGEWGQEGGVAGVGVVVAGQEGMVASNPDSHGKKTKIKPTEKPSKQPGDSPSPRQEERQKPKLKSGVLRVRGGWAGTGGVSGEENSKQ